MIGAFTSLGFGHSLFFSFRSVATVNEETPNWGL